MLPSDHFVRMYNELFKMLEEKGHEDLQRYWLSISKLQETLIGPFVEKDGLKGMYDYWDHIRIEENCDAEMSVNNDYFEFKMNQCPSLAKIMDNDAAPFEMYCDHCAGWVQPIMAKYGFHLIMDIVSRSESKCMFRIYKDKEKAEEFRKQVKLLAVPYRN